MEKFNFKKKYGQNFLKNKKVIAAIVESINPTSEDLIIEIGPGSGVLTKELVKYNSYYIAFEIDKDTSIFLDSLVSNKRSIIYEDFLKVDLNKILKNIPYRKLFIVGNLPYYITTPIIEKVIYSKIDPEAITIMVQKEVGERFLANTHTRNYGYMTVLLNYWYNIEKIIDADKHDFYPVPKVDSVVLKMNKKERVQINYEKFNTLLKESFKYKRKTIYNNLKTYDKESLEKVLKRHGASLNSRAEELDLETYIDMSENL